MLLLLLLLPYNLLRPSRSEGGLFQKEILPVLVLSDLEELELHVRRVVVGVEHEKGVVAVDPVEGSAGEDLHKAMNTREACTPGGAKQKGVPTSENWGKREGDLGITLASGMSR